MACRIRKTRLQLFPLPEGEGQGEGERCGNITSLTMRRFSQRSYLVTLSEINITPLLDLAFVLLIIFIITTPLLEQGLELKLPQGGKPDRPLRKDDFRTVEINARGYYLFDGRRLTLAQVQQELARS